MKLALFDIDGTLISTKGTDVISTKIIEKHFGVDISAVDIYVEGLTYYAILKKQLEAIGIEATHEQLVNACNDYVSFFEEIYVEGMIEKIEGVENLLVRLQKEGYKLGLLTGNTKEGSIAKLRKVALDTYFTFGAYGGDTDIRSELVPRALNEAAQLYGEVIEDVFLVGDTKKDYEAGFSNNLKVILVAQGKESFDDLKLVSNLVVPSYSDIDKLMEMIK